MKIVICGSMFASKKIMKCVEFLEKEGNDVVFPDGCKEYALSGKIKKEDVAHKVENDLIRGYFKKIKDCDCVLVVNVDKDGISNYIGGNSFLEIGFAYVLRKKIFLLNPVPNARYKDEIFVMEPIIINGDLSKIK